MRTIWFVAGTAAGVYASAKARRVADALTVDGLHDRLTGWFAGARVLRDEVKIAAEQKETQLRARLDAMPHGRALDSGSAAPAGRPAGRLASGLTGSTGNERED